MGIGLKQQHLIVPVWLGIIGVAVAILLAIVGVPTRMYLADFGFFLFLAVGYTFWRWMKLTLEDRVTQTQLEADTKALMLMMFLLTTIYELVALAATTFTYDFYLLRNSNPIGYLIGLVLMCLGLGLEVIAGFKRFRYGRNLLAIEGMGLFTAVSVVLLLSN